MMLIFYLKKYKKNNGGGIMKLDKYIRHLELKCKGLRKRHNELQSEQDKIFYKRNNNDENFYKTEEVRKKLKETNKKIDFLKGLKRELINNEVQDQKNKQR
jgi:seryl-tRNA synthetase